MAKEDVHNDEQFWEKDHAWQDFTDEQLLNVYGRCESCMSFRFPSWSGNREGDYINYLVKVICQCNGQLVHS